MNDHDSKWFAEWLRYRVSVMKPRGRALELKLCRAGAKLLLANIDKDLKALSSSKAQACRDLLETAKSLCSALVRLGVDRQSDVLVRAENIIAKAERRS